jgi:polysaccharide biosynthesis protein PslJ
MTASQRLRWPQVDASRRLRGRDGVTVLTVFIILLMGIPAQYVVPPLGAAGTPAQILGMGMAIWWAGGRLARPFAATPNLQPIRTAMLIFLGAAMISYVAANLRPIEGAEGRAADRGLLTLVALLGLILVAGDQIPSRARLDALLRRLVLAGAAVATLALVQFVTGISFTNYLHPPGLEINSELYGIAQRAGFLRPAGTAIHAIEFGVAMTIVFPLALHYAMADRHRGRLIRWAPVAVMAMSVPISVSRSAVVCAAFALGLMLPVMAARARAIALLSAAGLLGIVYVAVPGMLGAIVSLFTQIGSDNSAASRTGSYTLAMEFIAQSPVFGRGFATFLPDYRILDNQLLGTTIEMGVVGLLALLGLLGTGFWTAWRIRRESADGITRQLAQALLASLAAGTASLAFFDAFSFPMVAGLTFLILGTIGALRQLTLARSVAEAALGIGKRDVVGPDGKQGAAPNQLSRQ